MKVKKLFFIYWPICFIVLSLKANASDINWRHNSTLSPNDYLIRDHQSAERETVERQSELNLGATIELGAQCGRINLKNSLKSTLDSVINAEFFGDAAKDLLMASPMLALCFWSPSACSILKSGKINSSLISGLRIRQCALIDRFVDSKVEAFNAGIQKCVREEKKRNGGNIELAMKKCGNHNSRFVSWSGTGQETSENRLIDSSARWANLLDHRSQKDVSLFKALVGDSVYSRGRVSVDYGPDRAIHTPLRHYESINKEVLEKLNGMLANMDDASKKGDIFSTTIDMKGLSGDFKRPLVDQQTLIALSYMPYKKRQYATERLASAIALARFSQDMDSALNISSVLEQNPHLPSSGQRELRRKHYALKNQVGVTINLLREKNRPLNEVTHYINQEGAAIMDQEVAKNLNSSAGKLNSKRIDNLFADCADGIFCTSEKF